MTTPPQVVPPPGDGPEAETAGSWSPGPRDAITDIAGIRVGHWTDRRAGTGCTVILCGKGMAAAVDARGGAPGTRETDVLASANLVRQCHAILFAGGSAFGLAAADGVMRWLAEREIGFATAARPVPIVPAAVLYDLALGRAEPPTAEAGYIAAGRARGGAIQQGTVGAGTGATVAKLLGREHCLKGGVGTASLEGPRGIRVGAIVAVNAIGSLFDPETGTAIAAPRGEPGTFVPLPAALARRTAQMDALLEHTTLICVATNATLAHHELQRLAYHAHDGLARVVVPAHTFGDGDIAFAVSSAAVAIQPHDVLTVGVLAARAVEISLLRSIEHASGLHGVPAAGEWLATS
jgi:L-aminopeptidase/D-esterase-like protein